MDIKDYAQMMGYLTRPRDVVPEPRPMAQGGRIPFAKAKSVQKKPPPANYVRGNQLFEDLPISKKDYFRLKYKGGSLLTNTIDKLLKPKMITVPGRPDEFGFKKPTKEQKEIFKKISSRKGQLKPPTIKLMLEFDKKFSKFYENGELPTLKKIQEVFPDITPSTAGNVTARLSQWYNGSDFINPELEGINRNKSLATKIQKASANSQYGNFYADQAYKVALDTIDERIGRQVGSFKAFKDNIKTALKEAGLPIYSKNSPYGFNLNEMAGITGASRTKTAAFSDFVDIAEGNFNQKKLSRFQKDFAAIREKLDKLDLPNNPQNRKQALLLIKGFEDTIKYYENATGSELPKLGLGTADQYYSAEKLSDIGKERSVGETGKKKNRKIPGTDLLGSSQKSGYTVIVPENYRTVGQIMETGERGTLKKNVQNTLDGMKKFFNEYDEKKMLQKLKNATPDTLRKMMKVIPKFVSLEDDFTNAYGYQLTAGLDSDIGIQPVKKEENFIKRNPGTTAAAGTTAGTMAGVISKFTKKDPLKQLRRIPKKILGKLFTGASAPFSAGAFSLSNILDIDKDSPIGVKIQDDPNIKTAGAELLLPELSKKALSKLGGPKKLQTLLSLGKYGRALTPVGIATIGVGVGKDYYDFAKDEIARVKAMPEDERKAYNEALMDEGSMFEYE